jgi:hypothetical protein
MAGRHFRDITTAPRDGSLIEVRPLLDHAASKVGVDPAPLDVATHFAQGRIFQVRLRLFRQVAGRMAATGLPTSAKTMRAT